MHDDGIKWKHFPRYWPFVRGIHRSPVNSPHKGQWRGALMFSLICAWINAWVNNREAGDLRRHRAHYDVIIMCEGASSKGWGTLGVEKCRHCRHSFASSEPWWRHQVETFTALLALCALMFTVICAWTIGWANERDPSDLRCHGVHYDVTVMHIGNLFQDMFPDSLIHPYIFQVRQVFTKDYRTGIAALVNADVLQLIRSIIYPPCFTRKYVFMNTFRK